MTRFWRDEESLDTFKKYVEETQPTRVAKKVRLVLSEFPHISTIGGLRKIDDQELNRIPNFGATSRITLRNLLNQERHVTYYVRAS
jgi:hypothetical protein